MRILASSEAGGVPISCPNCYELFDYGSPEARQLPRILRCGHLVCSACAEELWCEGEICCPTCCELDGCESALSLPIAPASPLPSPQSSPFRVERSKKRVGFSETSGSASSPTNKLMEFVSSTPTSSGGGGGAHFAEEEQDDAQLKCLVDGCDKHRSEGRYFCSAHADKATRVSAKATKQMVMHYSRVSSYSISTLGLGSTLTDELQEPTLESLAPSSLREVFEEQGTITLGEALFIIDGAISLLEKEPNQLSLEAPVTIVGDIHGQFFDLCSMLDERGQPLPESPHDSPSYLFLGDYVDRGAFGCEVLLYLLALKLHFPNHVHLVRGNHECRSLTTHFGFKDECKIKYGLPVYYRFVKCFEMMPICAVVTNEHGRYFCTHGGISPSLTSLEQIDSIDRAVEPQMEGLLCDLLWADPADDPSSCPDPMSATDVELDVLLETDFQPNPLRGCSVSFGFSAAERFLRENNLLCVIRAHAVQEMGYYRHFEVPLKIRKGEDACKALPPVMTVFSAPNYCDRYGNSGAVLHLTKEGLEPEVHNYECVPHPSPIDLPNRTEMHFSALIEACPYMPSTFRDFVKMANRLGPAQPLFREEDDADDNLGTGGGSSANAEISPAAAAAAPLSPDHPSSAEMDQDESAEVPGGANSRWAHRRITTHDKYEAEAANDRINELHPVVVRKRLQGAGDGDAVCIGSSSNLTQHIDAASSEERYNIRSIREAYEASCRASQATPTSASSRCNSDGKGSNMVLELRKMFDKPGESGSSAEAPTWQRRQARNFERAMERESSQKSRTEFEKKTRAAISRGQVAPLAASKQVRLSSQRDAPPSRNYVVKDPGSRVRAISGLGERWLEKVRSSGGGATQEKTKVAARPTGHTRAKSKVAELYLESISPRSAVVDARDAGGEEDSDDEVSTAGVSDAMSTPAHSVKSSAEDALFERIENELGVDLGAAAAAALQEDLSSNKENDTSASQNQPDKLSGSSHRRSSMGESMGLDGDCMFSHAEILGLKLMFALMDQGGTEYIDATALENYAGEQNDYAQGREVQACIDAVDLDGDGKIGIMDFIGFAARAKFFWSQAESMETAS